ncbi:Bug family tripartite tricarboxylate transporter substrate binding protein [Pararoseomonas indoligenes]|uniref:Tripartite tricarboxylate transporter substrate binding protein n=1 Tax=Roseomonas indoligenes TaxID=2820811 RepID=A0A940N1S1_9PROT|nr:tripartite tricarboxylate transporter substrate binding protein [Pararoseomonas indoligenes]MBP0495182.1 tripartite tricarboxylate transporter substrate binding protein [Pararoseomonas indoligenes]
MGTLPRILPRRGTLVLAALAALLAPSALSPARAQGNWPNRPIRVIVPQPPGGNLDIIVRSLSEGLQAELGQPVVVENRPGGNSVIGLEACAVAAADGYTFCGVSVEVMSTYPYVEPQLFARYASLRPVTQIVSSPGVLLASAEVPARTLPEFVAWARGKRDLNYSSSGNGSSQNLLWEWIKARDHLEMQHVPYRGVSEAINELAAGRVQASYVALGLALPQIQAGRIKPLAVLGASRIPQLPDTPSMHEIGYDFPYTGAWWGLATAANTPPAIVERVARAVHAVVHSAGYRERIIAPGGYVPSGSTPAEFTALIEEERAKGAEIVRLAGVRPGN